MFRILILATLLMVSQVEARTVKVCTPNLKNCVVVKLPTRGCKTVMGYRVCK